MKIQCVVLEPSRCAQDSACRFGRQPEPVVIRARLGQRWLPKRTDEHGHVDTESSGTF